MTGAPFNTTLEEGVATLCLNRPEIHNAFDDVLISGLTGELKRLEDDDAIRVVVLAAKGKSFSAGADLNWMRRMADYSRDENLSDARALAALMQTLDRLEKPVIARVQGAAFGGGVGLVACCDIAIASATASFSLSEVKLGLIPAVISPYVVNAIGERQARRYFLTAERFSAHEALRIGLVHELVTAEELDARIGQVVGILRQNGPCAMRSAKDLARAVSRSPIDAALIDDTANRIADIRSGLEGREGVAAFLEKRTPTWR